MPAPAWRTMHLLITGNRFSDCGNVRNRLRSFRAGHAERSDLSRIRERQHRGDAVEHELYAARDHVGDRRRRAFIGNVNDIDSRHRLQQLAAEMVGRSITRRRAIELARFRFSKSDQFLHTRYWHLRIRKQQLWIDRSERYRRKVAKRIVGRFVQQRVDDQARRSGENERVAVGVRLRRDLVRNDSPAPARLSMMIC